MNQDTIDEICQEVQDEVGADCYFSQWNLEYLYCELVFEKSGVDGRYRVSIMISEEMLELSRADIVACLVHEIVNFKGAA